MPKVVVNYVEKIYNPFMLENGIGEYVDYCRKINRILDSFIIADYISKEIIIKVKAEIDAIILYAENKLPNICIYWNKLRKLMPYLEVAVNDDSTYSELQKANKTAEKILYGEE